MKNIAISLVESFGQRRALDKEELDFIMTLATIELSGGGASNLRPDVSAQSLKR